MLQRNIKQSLTALEIFNKLEEKIYHKDHTGVFVYTHGNLNISSNGYMGIKVKTLHNNIIYITLSSNNCELMIRSSNIIKEYCQILSDQEYNNIRERFLKIAQFCQDNFEDWIKETDDTNEIDAE